MLKKTLAIMLAAVMLIQPVAASAVTWGEVVQGLRNTGSYSGGGTSASLSGGVVSVSGGRISDVDIMDALANSYIFQDIVIDGESFYIGVPDTDLQVDLKGDTQVDVQEVYLHVSDQSGIGFSVHEDASVQAEYISMFVEGSGSGAIQNSGEISLVGGGISAYTEEGGTGSVSLENAAGAVIDSDYVSVGVRGTAAGSVKNSGDMTGFLHVQAEENGEVAVENSGVIVNDLSITAFDQAVVQSAVNSGTTNMYISTHGSASAAASHEGEGFLGVDACENSSITVKNSAVNWINSYSDDQASVHITNTADVESIDVFAYDDSRQTIVNTGDAAYWYFWAGDNAEVEVSHAGNAEYIGFYVQEDAHASLNNSGSVSEIYADMYDNGTVSVEGAGQVDSGVIYVNAPSADTYTPEQIKQLMDAIDLPASEDIIRELWIYTDTEEGYEWTAVYTIGEDGSITLADDFAEAQEPLKENGPSKEMIRHWMEVQRQEEAIGGVYGSPYWLKQANLGYHSIGIRLFEEGERVLFRQYLDWMYNGTGDKRMTLRANDKELADLMLYIDGKAIETLERTEITTITLVDYNYNPYMEYSVADLKAAREAYGLAETDMLCVGSADAQVMKMGADGKLVPVEQTQDAAQ